MPTIAVDIGKGGVGKSAATMHLGHAAARIGVRTLVVDLDPTTHTLSSRVDHEPIVNDGRVVNMSDLMLAEAPVPIAAVTSTTPWGFDLAPIDVRLTRWVEQQPDVTFRLRTILEQGHDYDLILLDVPPGLSPVTYNALAAADSVLVPILPDSGSLEAVKQFLFGEDTEVAGVPARKASTIELIRKHFNPTLAVAGIIVTAMERTRNAQHNVEELRAVVGELLWEPFVPRYAAMRDAETHRRPAGELTPELGGGAGSRRINSAYRALAEKLLSQGTTVPVGEAVAGGVR